ncbi:excisionase [Ligilactobacillus murinus]|jgi:excisionase family DNA binding protein|uniref:excisionase n=1 Tax=Ligilactobacillus murinus TaxID=1622 RepID=UPI00214BD6E7|nr:excisionase [Ligilactobacillus murinus]MCR1881185.1 excisionase [Ligilactobacillus murinus]
MNNVDKAVVKKYDVPIWHKSNLTIDEAVEYSGIGRERLRKMTSHYDCPFVLRLGHRRLIKRRAFDEYIEKLDFIE